jgi:hypothetical protein
VAEDCLRKPSELFGSTSLSDAGEALHFPFAECLPSLTDSQIHFRNIPSASDPLYLLHHKLSVTACLRAAGQVSYDGIANRLPRHSARSPCSAG